MPEHQGRGAENRSTGYNANAHCNGKSLPIGEEGGSPSRTAELPAFGTQEQWFVDRLMRRESGEVVAAMVAGERGSVLWRGHGLEGTDEIGSAMLWYR